MQFEKLIESIKNGDNVYMTGPGGTGKSYTLCQLVNNIEKLFPDKPFKICSSTNISALNINIHLEKIESDVMATSFHSFMGIGLGEGTAKELASSMFFPSKARIRSTKLLIIDEISMISDALFQKCDKICKIIRNDDAPFGGIQIIAIGDMLQLPPVNCKDKFDSDEENEKEVDDYIFKSKVWQDLDFKPIIFFEPHRYKDDKEGRKFFRFLIRMRYGKLNDNDIKRINRRVKEPPKDDKIQPTILFARRDDVNYINQNELDKIKEKLWTFPANDVMYYRRGKELISINNIYDNEFKALKKSKKSLDPNDYNRKTRYLKKLELKESSQVMLKSNLDLKRGLVNGSRGYVSSISKNSFMNEDGDIIDKTVVTVTFKNGIIISIDPVTEKIKLCSKLTIIRDQYPLKLCYAETVHGVQGCTIDCVRIPDVSSNFENAQTYVQFSRVSHFEALYLDSRFDEKSVKINKQALKFQKKLEGKIFKEICLY